MFSSSFFKTVGILSPSMLQCGFGVLGYPQGSAAELLDGSLKLRYCTTFFTKHFPPGFYLGRAEGLVIRRVVTSGNLLDCRGNFGKRVRLTRKTRPGAFSLVHPDPGHSTPRRWKRLCAPPSSAEVRVSGGGKDGSGRIWVLGRMLGFGLTLFLLLPS